MGLRTAFRNLLWRSVGAYPVRIRDERFVCHPRHCFVWRKLAAGKRESGALDILEKLPPGVCRGSGIGRKRGGSAG